MSDQPQLSRPIVLSSQLESMLDDNPTYTQSPFFHGWNKAVQNLRDWMTHKSNNPQFHWNATVRRHIDNDPCIQRLAVIHAPSSCSVFAPTLGLVVPAYALQDRDDPQPPDGHPPVSGGRRQLPVGGLRMLTVQNVSNEETNPC